jgi:hypothetical protein
MYPFFFAGYLFNKKRESVCIISLKKYFEKFGLIFIPVTVVLLLNFNYNTYIYNGTVTVWPTGNITYKEQLLNTFLRFTIGFTGSLAVIRCCMFGVNIKANIIKNTVISLGMQSFGVYIVSGYVISLIVVPLTENLTPSPVVWLLETVMVMSISVIITKALCQIRILDRICLGGR